MRTLLITDIHANLPALEAVLSTPEAQSCQRIISLGDQVNFGPQPREVMHRLTSLHALMLRGNHEERLLHYNDAAYDGYNWALQHWTAAQLEGIPLDHPVDFREGCKWFTHGTPSAPFHLIEKDEVPATLEALPEGITHLFSGHNHCPWMLEHHGLIACNPGSLGMLEDGIGGSAPFVVMDETDGAIHLSLCRTRYDLNAVKRAFITSGCASAAPEMARVVLHTMLTGEYQGTLKLVRYVSGMGGLASEEAWKQADRTWPWPDPFTSPQYWKNLEEELF